MQVRAEQQHRRCEHEPDLRTEQDPAPVANVDLRTEAQRHDHHREELHEADRTDGGRRLRERVNLHEERDQRDLAADLRQHLAGPEQPEIT